MLSVESGSGGWRDSNGATRGPELADLRSSCHRVSDVALLEPIAELINPAFAYLVNHDYEYSHVTCSSTTCFRQLPSDDPLCIATALGSFG